jgi:hypothetical protein
MNASARNPKVAYTFCLLAALQETMGESPLFFSLHN